MKRYISKLPLGACFDSPKLKQALLKIGFIRKEGSRYVPVDNRFGCFVDGLYIEFVNIKPAGECQYVDLFRKSYCNKL